MVQPQMQMGPQGMMPSPQGDQYAVMSRDQLAVNADIYAVGAALEVGASKEMRLQKIMQAIQIMANPMFQQNPLMSVDIWAAIEQIPYLLDLKLKRPLIMQGNPMLAQQERMQDQQLANQMMQQEMQAGMPPGAMAMGMMQGGPQGPPSRTKGELAKRDDDNNREDENDE
jgi:hypothetical protein